MKRAKSVGLIVVIILLVLSLIIIFPKLFLKRNPENQNSTVSLNSDALSGGSGTVLDCPVNFDDLKSQNNDICAVINMPGINLTLPILQSSDTEENFYLNYDVDRNQKTAGALYIQKVNTNDFQDNNTVIYGHNMKNGTMFGKLKKYRNTDFFNENETIYIYTPEHILTYNIFSAFIYNDKNIMSLFDFTDTLSYGKFLNDCKNPESTIKNVRDDIEVTTDDKIITLSTCAAKDDERYLVVAVLTSDQPCK